MEEEGPPALIEESEDEDGPGGPRDEVEPESDEDDEDMIGLISQGMPKEVAANFVSLYELFLINGVSPGVAKLEVSELFSPLELYLKSLGYPSWV